MSDKVKLALKQPKVEEIEYQGNIIDVKSYLSVDEQDSLINQYVEQYLDSPSQAEYILLIAILDTCTNIQLFKEDMSPALSMDDLLSHWDLVADIRSKIKNYNEFYAKLQMIVNKSTTEKNGLANVVQDGYAKILELIDSLPQLLSKLKISDEDMDKVKEISNSPILYEATKIFRQREQSKTTPATSPAPKKKPVKRKK